MVKAILDDKVKKTSSQLNKHRSFTVSLTHFSLFLATAPKGNKYIKEKAEQWLFPNCWVAAQNTFLAFSGLCNQNTYKRNAAIYIF